jgi:UDP:flavonoid glycosyltransferase YjiC (YdhE family)
MGARIVFTTWGSYGDVYPYLGLAIALRARGHAPALATSPYYRALVEGEGIEFHPVRPDVDPDDFALILRIMDPKRGAEVLLRELLVPSLRESYMDLLEAVRGADLLVTHPITFAGPIVAEQQQIPWVSTVLAPLSFFSIHDLPVFPPMPRVVHLRRLGTWMSRLLLGLAKMITRPWMEPVRTLRSDLGLPSRGDPLYEGQFSPGLTLAMFSRVLAEPQPDWPTHARITGFVPYNGPSRMSPELRDFLESGVPPVVFTLGSSAAGAAGTFYRESARSAAQLGVRAVLLVGRDAANRPPPPLPEGVFVTEHAPHQELFPRAAAIVHHGGIGTTGQALRSGRPMLIVPHAHDQPDNAFRVKGLGVARVLYPRHYTASRVVEHLRALLRTPRYSTRAEEMGRIVRTEDGTEQACQALETFIQARGRSATLLRPH